MNKTLRDQGLEIRKAVLGSEYVERAMAHAPAFAQPLQELITEYCWGAIWSRPGLNRRTRSLLNLAMLTALNRSHELKLHLRGALTNGVTPEEIQEALLQATVYAGVPAGVEAFRCAQEVLAEHAASVSDGAASTSG